MKNLKSICMYFMIPLFSIKIFIFHTNLPRIRQLYLKPSFPFWWRYNIVQLLWQTLYSFFKKLIIPSPYSLAIALLELKIRLHKGLYTNVHNSPKLGSNWVKKLTIHDG